MRGCSASNEPGHTHCETRPPHTVRRIPAGPAHRPCGRRNRAMVLFALGALSAIGLALPQPHTGMTQTRVPSRMLRGNSAYLLDFRREESVSGLGNPRFRQKWKASQTPYATRSRMTFHSVWCACRRKRSRFLSSAARPIACACRRNNHERRNDPGPVSGAKYPYPSMRSSEP